jgi:tRNA(Arg) A34 adenosine deaminase TadA
VRLSGSRTAQSSPARRGEPARARRTAPAEMHDRRFPHRVEVIGGVFEDECAALLREFFGSRR